MKSIILFVGTFLLSICVQKATAQVATITVLEAGYCKIVKQGPILDVEYSVQNTSSDTLHVKLVSMGAPENIILYPHSMHVLSFPHPCDTLMTLELLPGNAVVIRDLTSGITVEDQGKVEVTDIVPDSGIPADCPGCRH
jgi:hypothetical protein